MTSRVVSLRLKEPASATLERQARLMQRSVGETAAILLTEKLKQEEFPGVEFRRTSVGRLAYVKGTRVAVWLLVMLARDHDMDVRNVAEHLDWPIERVEIGLAYAAAYPGEIEPLVNDASDMTYEKLKLRVPGAQVAKLA